MSKEFWICVSVLWIGHVLTRLLEEIAEIANRHELSVERLVNEWAETGVRAGMAKHATK